MLVNFPEMPLFFEDWRFGGILTMQKDFTAY